MSSVIDLLKSHRSIRKFTDKAIDPEVLNDIFLAGQAAATSSFLQGSTIIRVKNKSTRESLARLAGNQPYVESAAGVKAGGRTGMTSLVIGLLFLACLFFSPLATSLPKEIDGAALIYIATLFVRNITDIEWDDIAESGPAVLAMIAMPFTYSISNGIALAFVAYAAVKLCTGKFDSTSPAIWVIAALSIVSFLVA